MSVVKFFITTLITLFLIVGCVDAERNIDQGSKVELVRIIEDGSDSGFEICLEDLIKYPYSRNMDVSVTLINGEVIESIYKKILKPETGKAKEGERCFVVEIYKETIHRRHPKQKDREVRQLLNDYWQVDSLRAIEVTIYKNTHSDKIYAKEVFDITQF